MPTLIRTNAKGTSKVSQNKHKTRRRQAREMEGSWREYPRRRTDRPWAGFKTKLAIILSLVFAGVLGLMFLEMSEKDKRFVYRVWERVGCVE